MSDLIEVGNKKPRKRVIADGIKTIYYFDFSIFNIQDLNIYINDVLLTTGYSVSIKPDIKGGNIIFSTPPEADTIITIFRNLTLKRTTNFKEVGPFMSSKVNYEFDYQLACIEQLEESISRTVTFPPYAPTQLNANLPLPQAGKAIIWNEKENSLQNSTFKLQDLDQHISDTINASKENLEILTQNQAYLEEIRATKEELTDIKPYIDKSLDSKLNIVGNNATIEFKQTIVDWSMPDYNNIIAIKDTSFTAPSNGWILMVASQNKILKPTINRNGVSTNILDIGTYTSDVICIFMPTQIDDEWSNLTIYEQLKFFPCIGG